jgi:hypothetical protein
VKSTTERGFKKPPDTPAMLGHQSACQSPLTDPRNSSKSPLTEPPSRLNVGAETPSTDAPIDPRLFPRDPNPLEFHHTRSPHNACPRPP